MSVVLPTADGGTAERGVAGDEMNELGTLRSWCLDAVLGGALFPAATYALFVGAPLVMGQPLDAPGRVAWEFLVVTLGGAAIGGVMATPSWFLAARAFRVTPTLAFVLGPVLGGLAALALIAMAPLFVPAPPVPAEEVVATLGFGAIALGPPWIAYVAVRSRGRSGTPVVLATPLWVWVPIGLVVFSEWLTMRP